MTSLQCNLQTDVNQNCVKLSVLTSYRTESNRYKDRSGNFDILLTVHLNIFILILTNLMH